MANDAYIPEFADSQQQQENEYEQWLVEHNCCVFCGEPRANKPSCCGEVRFYGE